MKLQEICHFLELKAPLRFQEDYDNSGLLMGDPFMEITGAVLCLDVTPKVLDEAIGKGFNLIISHHPFLFKGIKKLVHGSEENDLVSKAIKNDLAIYAIHTNLDNAMDGLNALLMRKIGITNYRILAPRMNMLSKLVTFSPIEYAENVKSALFAAGAGMIGNYDCCSFYLQGKGTFRASADANPFVGRKDALHTEPEIRIEVIVPEHRLPGAVQAMIGAHPYEEVAYDIYPLSNPYHGAGAGIVGDLPEKMKQSDFLDFLKSSFGLKVIRHTKTTRKPLKRVALCSGSGAFLIPDSITAAADAFVTADLKYHDFFKGEGKILLVDIGHYESEHLVKEWLFDVLVEKFPNFACLKSQVNTNPIHYL